MDISKPVNQIHVIIFIMKTPNVMAEWLALFLYITEVLDLNYGLKISNSDWVLHCFPQSL